jgi:DnaJ-domain-containing protein 1
MRFFRKREPADPFAAFSERYGVQLPRTEPEEAPPEDEPPKDERPKDEPGPIAPPWAHVALGVGLGASQEEISAAYRRLARKHHPDVAGDEERMKVINSAYRELRRSAGRSTPPQESI